MTTETLINLASEMASGAIRVVDPTVPLDENTPVIGLPEEFAQSPSFKMEQISHFDAPGHWVTGKGYADGCTDTIPPKKLVAPANVIDVWLSRRKTRITC